jgi:hypothetical protein
MPNEDNLKPFKKGEDPRRNLDGRPKGSKGLRTVLKELLSAKDPKGEWANPVAMKLLQKAFSDGHYPSLIEIIDRIEGKSQSKLEMTGKDGKDLNVTLNVVDIPTKEETNETQSEPKVVDLKKDES